MMVWVDVKDLYSLGAGPHMEKLLHQMVEGAGFRREPMDATSRLSRSFQNGFVPATGHRQSITFRPFAVRAHKDLQSSA